MAAVAVLLVKTNPHETANMGKEFKQIDTRIKTWVERQHLFFVSTAPLSGDGMINCSPKGLDGLRVTGPQELVYADVGGSGIETVAHVRENGRIVIMLCAFEGPPRIFRFYGTGTVVEADDADYERHRAMFSHLPSVRNFVVIEVTCIRDACGFGVPEFVYQRERDAHRKWSDTKTTDQLDQYRREKNARSLDGLPGLRAAEDPT